MVNVAANFDGRRLGNLKEVVKRVHKDGDDYSGCGAGDSSSL